MREDRQPHFLVYFKKADHSYAPFSKSVVKRIIAGVAKMHTKMHTEKRKIVLRHLVAFMSSGSYRCHSNEVHAAHPHHAAQ